MHTHTGISELNKKFVLFLLQPYHVCVLYVDCCGFGCKCWHNLLARQSGLQNEDVSGTLINEAHLVSHSLVVGVCVPRPHST